MVAAKLASLAGDSTNMGGKLRSLQEAPDGRRDGMGSTVAEFHELKGSGEKRLSKAT